MKKVKEFCRDIIDKNPWAIGFIGFCLIYVACHLFVEHTALGQAIHEFNLNPNWNLGK